MTDIEQDARAEAKRRWPASRRSVEFDDARANFVDGALWAASRPASPATREAVERAVRGALWNVSNYPEAVQARMLGQDINGLVNAVMERLARFTITEKGDDR